ncbi:hypothetical protein [Aquimarina algicola]|uniref:hypothetical protein n=1 Tax=Aquimarina algicola TaxID=2589995 RepID=UPI001CF1D97C|nr:hypothetical protein [Aquimarina algicola]
MRTLKWILPILAIVAAVVFLFWIIPKEEAAITEQYRQQIETLEYHNQKLLKVNEILDNRVFYLEAQADSLLQLIEKDQIEITTLKKTKNEKIPIINAYSDHELLRFFANLTTKSDSSEE